MNEEKRSATEINSEDKEERVKLADLIPVPKRKKAELFRHTKQFINRAIKIQREMSIEYHELLEKGETDTTELFNKYVNVARRKLKQGRAWSKQVVGDMLTSYKEFYDERKAAEEEANDSEPVEETVATDNEEE